MKAQFDNASLKIWFSNSGTSRNLHNVVEIEHVGNVMTIKQSDGKTTLVNFDNVNSIEEM